MMTKEEAIKELKILKENFWDDDGYGHETKQYDNTMFALDMAIKALEQEPPKATWEGIEYDGYAGGWPVYDVWECTHCGYEHPGESDTLTDYCPGCGAKMTESEE